MTNWNPMWGALVGLAVLSTSPAHAGGFTPWGSGTGANTVALSPYLFVGGDGSISPAPYVFFGLHDKFDLMAGYSFTVVTQPEFSDNRFSSGAIELMPRATLADEAVIALHTLYTPGADDAILGLEFHGVTGTSFFNFTYNTGWWPTVGGADGFGAGDWFAILAPEFLITDRFSLFTEFNPSVNLTGDAVMSATVVPGLTFYVDKEMKHSLTAAATLSVAPTWGGATFGLLYWTDFDIGKKSNPTPVTNPVTGSRAPGGTATALTSLDALR